MKKTLGKVLAGAIIGSFLMIGNAFALPYEYFSTTDFTTGENGNINLYAQNFGDSVFGIYWVDDITGTPPVVTESLDVNFKDSFIGQIDWKVNGTAWNVKNYFVPGAGVTNVPDLFGFYFEKNGIRYFTDPALSGADSVTVTKQTDTVYDFTHGDDVAKVTVDDITATANAPVPEPATMLLFGAGLVGLVGAVRRKTRK